MAFATDSRRALAAVAALVSTAVLVWFGNGLDPFWLFMWIAPLPVLLFSVGHSWRPAALVAFLSMLAGCLNLWHYLHSQQTPFLAWLAIFSVAALAFALAVVLFRALVRRGAFWRAALGFPAVWVAYEFARNLLTPHGTAGSIAYSQLDFLPFLQFASVGGPWGMSFLLFWFPAAMAIGWHLRRSQPRQAQRIAGGCAAAVALVLVFGAIRLALPKTGPTIAVGLIASDQFAFGPVAREGESTGKLFLEYAATAEQLASRGARVIVIPEKIGVVADPNAGASDAIFQRVADRSGATIVAGEIRVSGKVQHNEARVYAPGAPVQTYDKHHLLPPFESSQTPGSTLTFPAGHSKTWGVAICKDMDFTPLSREYGQAGVGLMLVPAWDFRLDRQWHGHIAVMRGVEDGFTVARASRDGNLTISDDRGRILAEIRSDSAPFATLMTEAPSAHHPTLYLDLGDWFAWLSLATLAFSLSGLRGRSKVTPPAKTTHQRPITPAV